MFWKDNCYGSATVGDKGQVVIPAEARKKLGIEKGDKVFVFGNQEHGVMILIPAGRVSEMVSRTLEQLTELSSTLGLKLSEASEETPDAR